MFKIPIQNSFWEIDVPQIMGILNVTPDSFYTNSRVNSVEIALEKVEQFIQEGAQIIDIGGQSTRPGASYISVQEEINNVCPVIEKIRNQYPQVFISIDSFHSQVAQAAINAGANIVNDISCGSFDNKMLEVVATNNVGFIGMHITGSIETMHQVPNRTNIMDALIQYFTTKKEILATYGIEKWVIDPGFGFGKTIQENFRIVKALKALEIMELPILLGVSRKSSIYKTLNCSAEDALNGTTVLNTVGLLNGANILRVHDVKAAKEAITLIQSL